MQLLVEGHSFGETLMKEEEEKEGKCDVEVDQGRSLQGVQLIHHNNGESS